MARLVLSVCDRNIMFSCCSVREGVWCRLRFVIWTAFEAPPQSCAIRSNSAAPFVLPIFSSVAKVLCGMSSDMLLSVPIVLKVRSMRSTLSVGVGLGSATVWG